MLDFSEFNNRLSIVKEDFSKMTLNQFIYKNDINFEEFFHITLQLCDCIEYLDQNHIVHKDITPDNILIDTNTLKCKISDFGIAQLNTNQQKSLTVNKQLEGSLLYLSPEQTGRINKVIDHRTDIYSLG